MNPPNIMHARNCGGPGFYASKYVKSCKNGLRVIIIIIIIIITIIIIIIIIVIIIIMVLIVYFAEPRCVYKYK